MKILKFVAIFAISVALLTVAFISIFSITSKEESSSVYFGAEVPGYTDSEETSSETAESSSDSKVSETTESTEETVQETVKTVLENVTIPDITTLSTAGVTWGPGVSFNSENQPSACVSLQEKYGDLGAVFLNNDNKIYLTFDLGYESGFTADILDVLKSNNVKATFFLTGSYAKNQEELVQRIISEGHTVGNHSLTHPDMTTVSDEEAVKEIMDVHNLIKEKYGYESYLFRFPAGTFSEKTLAIAAQNGYHSIFWSFAYNDWDNANQPDQGDALKKVCERLHPGAVYLLHPMETNSRILNDFIANAKLAGYEIGVF